MLPVRIDFDDESKGIYPKEAGVPCFCIGEGGENILQITKPLVVAVPVFGLDSLKEHACIDPDPTTEKMLKTALGSRISALAEVANKVGPGYQIIVRVKGEVATSIRKQETARGCVFTISARVGLVALIPRESVVQGMV